MLITVLCRIKSRKYNVNESSLYVPVSLRGTGGGGMGPSSADSNNSSNNSNSNKNSHSSSVSFSHMLPLKHVFGDGGFLTYILPLPVVFDDEETVFHYSLYEPAITNPSSTSPNVALSTATDMEAETKHEHIIQNAITFHSGSTIYGSF